MKFHCNSCGRDFTTLSERDKDRKFALHHIILDKMRCPHCGASNHAKILKPLKTTRNRYQPKRRSTSDDNYAPPNIVVHPDCQKRMVGTLYSPEGLQVVCESCPSRFNCLTGNVDDGEYIAPSTKSLDVQREEAKVVVAKKKHDEAVRWLQDLRKKLGKVGLSYEAKGEFGYCKLGGTTWKLSTDDLASINDDSWATIKTSVIKKSLDNKKIDTKYLQYLCKLG